MRPRMLPDSERGTILEIEPHHARFHPPDLITVRWVDSMSAEAIDSIFQWSDAQVGADTRYFVIADMSRLETVSPAVRKAAAADPRSPRIAGIAVVGASAHMRAVMGMFMKALSLFYGERFRMAFFDTEDEAFTWVQIQRVQPDPMSERKPGT